MRRVLSSVTVVLGVVALAVGPGAAAAAARADPPKKACTIKDTRLVELSGLVALKNGYVVINDSSESADRQQVFFLDAKCAVSKTRSYSGNAPRDTEDLGLSPDGKTLYLADTGDNDLTRSTVVLWTMPVSGSAAPQRNRLTYPDGKHDAEALLFNGDGTPIIITRGDAAGKAGLYSPTGPLQAGTAEGVPMKKLGEVTLPKTATSNPFGAFGRFVVTGGATAPDGSRVVLRTYADAFEWDVTNGDVVAALTTGTPRATALPDEPLGEAIAYSPDGKFFLTVSEVVDQPEGTWPEILRYTPATETAPPLAGDAEDSGSWLDDLTLDDITYLIGSVGVLGAVLVGVGVFGIVRARRRPKGRAGPDGERPGRIDDGRIDDGRAGPGYPGYGVDPAPGRRRAGSGDGHRGDHPGDGYDERGRRQRPGGVYGPGAPAGGGVYGGGSRSGGGVYGGGRGSAGPGAPAGGGVYGGGSRSGGGVYGGGRGSAGPGAPAGGGVYGGGSRSGGGDDTPQGRSGHAGHPHGGYPNNGPREPSGRYGQRRAGRPDYPDNRYDYR